MIMIPNNFYFTVVDEAHLRAIPVPIYAQCEDCEGGISCAQDRASRTGRRHVVLHYGSIVAVAEPVPPDAARRHGAIVRDYGPYAEGDARAVMTAIAAAEAAD